MMPSSMMVTCEEGKRKKQNRGEKTEKREPLRSGVGWEGRISKQTVGSKITVAIKK